MEVASPFDRAEPAMSEAAPLALAADDEPEIRELVALRLERLGYRVLQAGDGRTALRLATDHLPEVAVLDVGMVGLDGFEVARRLRAAPETRDMALIILTAREAEDDVDRGFDSGADAYIEKPFSAQELSESVRRVAAERALRRREALARRVAALEAALGRVATAVAAEETPRTVFGMAAEEAGRLLEADLVAVLRVERADDVARVAGAWTRTLTGARPGAVLALRDGDVLSLVSRSGRPGTGPLPGPDPWLGTARAAPVTVAGRAWGVLVVAGGRARLDARVDGHLSRFAHLAGLAVANAESRTALATLAATDGLTGLPNQRTFRRRLAEEVERARRHGRPMALALFDLDHFKRVNDEHGHEAGDRVLAEAARRLGAQARSGELVARAGGEEFAWILPGTGGPGAYAAAERARAAVAGEPFPAAGTVTASAGVSSLEHAADGDELFRQADAALYRAKAAGRDTCVLHLPGGG